MVSNKAVSRPDKTSKAAAKKPSKKAAAKAPDKALLKALKQQLTAAILPGDTPLPSADLAEAAEFLLEAAASRAPSRSLVKLESATGERRRLRIAVVNDDMPFLVDSIAATITAHGLSIDRLVHPVLAAQRDETGQLIKLCAADDAPSECRTESMIYCETPRIDARQRRALIAGLRATLSDVRAAVTDWPKVQKRLHEDAASIAEASPEASALLTWLNDGMLTQLGHVTRRCDGSESDVLGVCRKSAKELLSDASFARAFDWFDTLADNGAERDLLVIKSNRIASVHRHVPLDLFIIPQRENGTTTSLSVHAGVWTSAALAARPADVPILRTALAGLTEQLGFDRGSHAGKALVHAFTALPHDLLIAFDPAAAQRLTTTMMSLIDRPRPRLVLIQSALARHVFAFVWLPRDLLSTAVRLQIQNLLTETPGTEVLDWSLTVDGSNLARLQFMLDTRSAEDLIDAEPIETQLEELLRGWSEAVEAKLAERDEGGRANAIASRYAAAFPQGYRSLYGAGEAAEDIGRIRALAATSSAERRGARLYRLASDEKDRLRLKIYLLNGDLALSDAVPALENFGFRVITEIKTELASGLLGTVHDFMLAPTVGSDPAKMLERADIIETAIAEVLNGEGEDDPFNRLVVGNALSAREATWLRAIYRYLRQTGMGFTIYTVVNALSRAPTVTRAMIDLFVAAHDPGFKGERADALKSADRSYTSALAQVAEINDDRLLRLYRAVIDATLRTNAFASAASEALAFKLDSSLVPDLPKPVPWREIFVFSRRVEGIHLRAGPVARGGLRWSDRRDDFRTEILGLMKAQRVKNAVIVPTGAKGGFYPKQLPDPAQDREGWAAEGQASYEVFIRTLLSVTDNIVGDKVVHPADVVIHDGDDPYFVVAADKGTARFSDIANGIAQSQDFWLDDAFASGGSNGYDHKAMGITARGAWVSVQRHFLEQGIDVQSDSIRVAGCGDMSGDVFGNGMLLSKAIKLVAAFDHRHIFIDPDPDPATSWKERKRLFDLPRSNWEDYDSELISRGGGVFARDLKRIKLSKRARETLGIEAKEIEPDALVSAILKAPLDLIWFGGIGTYIKAASEADLAVGDPANDSLRVNADEVRAKAIGEGANLGVTQAGRIDFALGGGRINTDFIDNSAGVDCSDNEVNIKIALAAARRSGKLSDKRRNALLEDMTDAVADIVLEDNRLQALALSIAEADGASATGSYIGLIERLEAIGGLDRRTEGLADNETLNRRASDGQGLTRPELAVLLSSTKLAVQDSIEASELPDDPALEATLIAMFPEQMRKPYAKQIAAHQLRRELLATELANRIVNRMGLLAVFELAEEEGVTPAVIANAFVAADQLFDMGALWRTIDEASVSEEARIQLFERAARALRGHMGDLLRAGAAKRPASELADELAPGIATLAQASGELITGEAKRQSDRLRAELVDAGAPNALAVKVVHLFEMDGATGLALLARDSKLPIEELTSAFTDLGRRLGLDWAQQTATMMEPSDIWERLLVAGLARDFQQLRLEFMRNLLISAKPRKATKINPVSAVEDWAQGKAETIRQFKGMVTKAQNQVPVAPAVLAQIASQARNVLDP
ncbi:MAG: NAD-glutamate dehydrogenase domain-containing protein [Pseudomonadota bacterium]